MHRNFLYRYINKLHAIFLYDRETFCAKNNINNFRSRINERLEYARLNSEKFDKRFPDTSITGKDIRARRSDERKQFISSANDINLENKRVER